MSVMRYIKSEPAGNTARNSVTLGLLWLWLSKESISLTSVEGSHEIKFIDNMFVKWPRRQKTSFSFRSTSILRQTEFAV